MLIFHSDTDILVTLDEEDKSLAAEHIRNGYPELLEDWEAGRIRATRLEGFTPMKCLVMDAGKPRPMTDDEIKTRDAALAAEISDKASAADLEAKIQSELRTLALERLTAKGEG
jgi:hypothetical protein